MVIDRLSNADLYGNVQPGVEAALNWLRSTELASLPVGKTLIDGDALFAIVAEYTPKDPELCRLEAHRDYWDVQYVAEGVERMGWLPLSAATESVTYDKERDVAFFAETDTSFFRVATGFFTIFGPHDVHMPGVSPEGATADSVVRKIVVKVRATH
ncbi:MAG: YhcH/YjgK/YiaL family protein [Vicinamibacterales bacterium]